MFGRRSHQRFSISPSTEGVLRVVQDVILQAPSDDELIAVGRRAGVVGDRVTVELANADSPAVIDTRVVESRPMIFDGAVRHQLRLAPVSGPKEDSQQIDDFMTRLTASRDHDEQ
jgi:hypothetical protein